MIGTEEMNPAPGLGRPSKANIMHPNDTQSHTLPERPQHRYKTPPGHRIIHAVVAETTFVHAHKMALESGMRFSHYLARFLEEAFPYQDSTSPTSSSPDQAKDVDR